MDKKMKFKSNDKLAAVLKSLLCSYCVTGILLLVLAFLLYRFRWKESQINVGIIAVYVIATLLGGFVCGKLVKVRKFLWGLVIGVSYFLLLLAVSLIVYRTLQQGGIHLLTTFALCMAGGMLGGMIS
ncbi:MAG: TIGR04086 family membrane protein [Hespellia sp.]|nr:TIGR04086 family membrane protein [Hespellia sp.]